MRGFQSHPACDGWMPIAKFKALVLGLPEQWVMSQAKLWTVQGESMKETGVNAA